MAYVFALKIVKADNFGLKQINKINIYIIYMYLSIKYFLFLICSNKILFTIEFWPMILKGNY